jgi:hypothetical protein
MTVVLDRLSQTNSALQSIIGNAGLNLTAIESTLNERVKEFQIALGTVSSQVVTLNQTASSTLSQATDISSKIGSQNQELERSVDGLRHAQSELDTALDSRRRSLEALLGSVDSKSEEFRGVTNKFQTLIEDMFRDAETRGRNLSSFLVDSTQSVSGLIGQQFDEIRASSGEERERTAAALRAAYEQANAEMSQIFGQITERFESTLSEMRGMSVEIHRELETTRQELRRGATELPRETSEQASAMRRVVAEQIKALNELTDIVARSGRAYDVAEAAPLAPRAGESFRKPEPARTETFRSAEAFRPEPARAEPTRLPEPPAREESPFRPRAPIASAPSRPPQTQSPPPSQDRGTGWLSDLLARASREEPVAEPRRSLPSTTPATPQRQSGRGLESLDSITRDIARMVDHDAAAEAWELYNGGERNAFSRRLYTAQGQQTFDEIRRRYRNDADFRETVDRYVHEFERLLVEVGRDDHEGSLMRTYLTSETGKVYTMLSHASGHFD